MAALLYAVFSSPTPDAPGWAEYTILILLGFAAFPFQWPRERWVLPLGALLIYGLTVPLLYGVLAGSAGIDMVRDVIAFMALAIPLMFAGLYPQDDPKAQRMLLILLLSIGFIFSVRYISSIFTPLGLSDHDLLYLANSPLVPFSAAWLLLHGCFREKIPIRALLYIGMALIPIAAMIGMMQRATVILLALAWLLLVITAFINNPKRALIVLVGAVAVLAIAWPIPELILDSLRDKTLAVGWNARGAEFATLIDQIDGNFFTALFGDGWGSEMKSPAVGNLWVRYSHALATALLWKTGMIGLALACAAFGAMVLAAWRRLRHDMVIFLTLVVPLLPALFLYGSYKSLCFGLLLLGLVRLGNPNNFTNTHTG